ncbi:MAG TPA: TetR family transcriptional regulator [Pseudonocardia sp.]
MTDAVRPYGGVPAGQRRARRRAALLEAALDLLAEDGPAGVTVRAVCGRARLNDRYFAESFPDRDALLLALLDELLTGATAEIVTALDGQPVDARSRVRAGITAAVAYLDADPRRGRLLLASQATEALQRRRHDTVRLLAALMADQARELLGERAPSRPDTELASITLVGGALELLAAWLRGELAVTREHLTDFLIAMILTSSDLAAVLDREVRRG